MGVWMCPDCGCVSIRTGMVQIEIDFEDALSIMVPVCQQLIAIHQAGGPPNLHRLPHAHEEPEDLGEELTLESNDELDLFGYRPRGVSHS